MKSKIIFSKGKAYVQLPEEFNKVNELEFIKVKEGLYVIELLKETTTSVQKSQTVQQEKQQQSISKEEFALLNKVSLIRYSDRTLQNLSKSLNKVESQILKDLLGKKTISTSRKNNLDYISFPDELYDMLKNNSMKKPVAQKTDIINIENSFFIIPRAQMQNFMNQMQSQMDKISYVIGSDGNIYVADKKKAKDLYKKIINELKKGRLSLQEIAKDSNLREEICLILLKLMGEEGIIYEPEKNIFEMVE